MKWKKEQTTILLENYSSLKSMVEKDSNDNNSLAQLAECCLNLKKFDEAEKIYDDLIKQNPDSCKYHYRLGKVYSAQNMWDKALKQHEKAIEIWSDFSWAKVEKAKCEIALNREDDARSLLEDTLINLKYSDKDKILFINIYKLLFELYNKQKMFDKCILFLKKLIEIDPSEGFHYYNLGKVYLEIKDYENALINFNECKKFMQDSWIDDKIAISLTYLNRYGDAVNIYKHIPYNKMQDYIHQHYGRLLLKMNMLEEAKAELKKALRKPGLSKFNSHFYLGKIYEELGMFKNAILQYELSIKVKQKEFNIDFQQASERIAYIKNNCSINNDEEIEDYEEFKIGTIIKFIDNRGFGFLKDEQNNEYFFHIKNCRFKSPQTGNKIKFELIEGKKGLEAVNIQIFKN